MWAMGASVPSALSRSRPVGSMADGTRAPDPGSPRLRPSVTEVVGGSMNAGDTAWVLVSAALVLFMTPGLALFYGGMVRAKNGYSVMMHAFVCMGLVTVIWAVGGFSLAFGRDLG